MIIDADYCDNPDNEGEIFFQLINLSPFDIQLRAGDRIGQGIIMPYTKTYDDNAEGARTGGFGSTDQKEIEGQMNFDDCVIALNNCGFPYFVSSEDLERIKKLQ